MANQYFSVPELIEHIDGLGRSELQDGLRRYLYEGYFGSRTVLSGSDWHIVVSELYAASGVHTKEKLQIAFSALLESFEPSEPASKEDSRFVFHLLSLAATIRNPQAKERLRRWLYANAFEGWVHGPFSLHAELVLATSAYDSDDQWLHCLKETLPPRPSFSRSALATYRALLQTRGIECLAVLPDVLFKLPFTEGEDSQRLTYLLGLTVRKVGARQFADQVIAVLDRTPRPVPQTFIMIPRLRDIIGTDLLNHAEKERERLCGYLRSLWDRTATRWAKLSIPEAYDALDRTLEATRPGAYEVLPSHFRAQGIRQVIIFNGEYPLQLTDQHAELIQLCQPFFKYATMASSG